MTDPIIIIGTGLAGYMVAKEFRKLDQTTPLLMLTQDDGYFYSKPLLSNSLTAKRTADAIPTASAEDMAVQLPAEIRTNVAINKIDPAQKCVFVGDEKLHYHTLVLAVGGQVIEPALAGDAVDQVLSVNDLQDYRRFRDRLQSAQHVTILGGGLVGCEFANDLANNGLSVEVISDDECPLSKLLPRQVGVALQHALANLGVHWHFSALATHVSHAEKGFTVTLNNAQKIQTDLVLSAVGIYPNVMLARQASLETNVGVCVDRTLQTSDPHIFALGDCAEVDGLVLQYVAPLLNCARALAKTLAGEKTQVNYPAMPVVLKTPANPTVGALPVREVAGEWQMEQTDDGMKCLYHDADGDLQGFVVTGKFVRERAALVKELPGLFANAEVIS